jgi:hypothetical protein
MRKYWIGLMLTITIAAVCGPSRSQSGGIKSSAEKAQSAEKVADFSGVWEAHEPPSARKWAGYSFTGEIPPMTPWGKEQYEKTKPSWGPRAVEDSTDLVNPTTGNEIGCFPTGVPRIYVHPFPFEIVQTPGRVIELFEFNHFVRQIYTNGPHQHSKDLDPTWMGDSIGWWEGDTRPKHDTLIVHITIDDPKAYTKTFEGERIFQLEPDWKLVEMICEDNITFNELKKAGKEQ